MGFYWKTINEILNWLRYSLLNHIMHVNVFQRSFDFIFAKYIHVNETHTTHQKNKLHNQPFKSIQYVELLLGNVYRFDMKRRNICQI